VDVGDTVAEGQVLATLDDADAKTELARERANRRSEQATLGRLRSDEDQVKLREEIARREAERSERLQKAGAIPEIENDRSQDVPRLVALDRRGVELQREVILAKLAQAEAREAQASLWIHESELPYVRAGASVQLTLRDRERTRLQGRVRRVHLEADQRTHEVRVDVELASWWYFVLRYVPRLRAAAIAAYIKTALRYLLPARVLPLFFCNRCTKRRSFQSSLQVSSSSP
jgi:multidrug efflux pump subunit AcrA (membrane-fusion protein)